MPMYPLLLFFAGLNLAYFAFVAYLGYRARRYDQHPSRGEYTVRLWGCVEFTTGFRLPCFNVSLGGYEEPKVQVQIYWVYGCLFLYLPIKTRYSGCETPTYGVSLTDIDGDGWQQIHWHWGRKTWIWDMPWTLQWHSTSYLFAVAGSRSGHWMTEQKGGKKLDVWEPAVKASLLREIHPYLYTLKDGTAQHRYATITYVNRRWRRKALPFTDLFSLHAKRIEIDFDREVGEGIHHWKGGTVGCSYDIKPGETGEQALRRMEATRIFSR